MSGVILRCSSNLKVFYEQVCNLKVLYEQVDHYKVFYSFMSIWSF